MFRFVFFSVSLMLFAFFTSADNFPTDIQRCTYSDSKCLSNVITHILRTYSKTGHRGLNIIPFDPLHVKNLVLKKLSDRPVNVEFKFKDIDLTGISQGTVHNVSGFTKEPSDFVLELDVNLPKITLTGPYSINGRVLVLPIAGEGNSKISLENIATVAKAKCTIVEKNGQKFINLHDGKLDLQPTRVTFQLENLFNGDKALGKSMNKLLNENWEVVFSELKPLIDETMAKLAVHLANGVFSKIPYSDLFLP